MMLKTIIAQGMFFFHTGAVNKYAETDRMPVRLNYGALFCSSFLIFVSRKLHMSAAASMLADSVMI